MLQPNENLPRVLLEQFTIGRGQFTEADVHAVAHAFTGWFISQDQLRYSAREHVSAPSSLLGQAGDFEKKDVIRILLQQRATARWVVARLYRWLFSETGAPPETVVAPLADSFAKTLDIAALAETMLRSNLFFSSAAYRQKIKSPVEFALGIIRPLNGVVGTMQLGADLAGLGQDLYDPPTIEGWAGDRCWINSFTMLARVKLAQALLAGSGAYGGKLDPLEAAAKNGGHTPEASGAYLLDLFLQGDVNEQVRRATLETVQGSGAPSTTQSERVRRLAVLISSLPEFHLA